MAPSAASRSATTGPKPPPTPAIAITRSSSIRTSSQLLCSNFLSGIFPSATPEMICFMENTPLTGPHRRERAVNRRVQGDIGELSAMEWLASQGATVWVPFNHSPHVDLMAEWDDRLIKVQVKTSTYRWQPKAGGDRWKVSICTNGGNRSWTGLTKKFDPVKVDHLFVLVGDGRRWFIPAGYVEAAREVTLGGRKYSEFEI